MDIIFTARHTDVRERFRTHASAKLAKIEKLDGKAIRIDVQVTAERNPRQAGRRERVELTVTSRGPAIRAEAAAEDRLAAFDLAFDKLESRLRRLCDRRKGRHGARAAVRLSDLPEADLASDAELPAIRLGRGGGLLASNGAEAIAAMAAAADAADTSSSASEPAEDETREVEIDMQGEGPLVVREKFHAAAPMTIDQALFEMELVGHDFFLFSDVGSGMPSVVYRRRGYRYGVIRLMEESEALAAGAGRGLGRPQNANGQVSSGLAGEGEAQSGQGQSGRSRQRRAASG
ncbi:MAG TPA: ribosome-associated translation inhibitor RaiA [Streptosporangiaceae bacterium]